jgi:hypothetical protein
LPPGYEDYKPVQVIALDAARALRPVKLTILFSLVPPAIYGFIAALLWIVRGFRADPAKAASA